MIAAVLLVPGGVAPGDAAHGPAAPARASVHASPGARPPIRSTVVPLRGPVVNATFFGNNSTFAGLPVSSQYCNHSAPSSLFLETYCYPQAQNPSVLVLPDGDTGIAYSTFTSQSATGCAAAKSNTTTRIAFQLSTDDGAHFGPAVDLGNDTCSFLQATEPSFAVGGNGVVFGTFVEGNASTAAAPLFPPQWVNRTRDALGFVASSPNATSWGSVRSINLSNNIARPVLAAFGQTLYIV